jgi:hypothetical protein
MGGDLTWDMADEGRGSMNGSTYHVRQEAQAVAGLLEGIRTDGGDEESVEITIASESNLKEAASAVVLTIMQDEAHIASLKETVSTLRARADRLAARTQRCRSALMAALEACGLKKLHLDVATVSVGRGAPAIVVTDEELVPTRFRQAAPQVEAAYEQLLRASAYAASHGNPEMQEDFTGTAEKLLVLFQLDKRAIAAALKAGEQVAGCCLSNGSSWLTVRVA